MRSSGPGPITADGCPIELYVQLPAMGEAVIVRAAVPPGASILDLGCGTGRITHGLVALGHDVVGVDHSREMLAHVRGAETVCAPIAGLDLERRFGAVLMASHLVNTPDDDDRHALLAAGTRHLADDGRLVVEWHPPEWFDRVSGGAGGAGHCGGGGAGGAGGSGAGGRMGAIDAQLLDVTRDGDLLSATVRYWTDTEVWTHPFTTRRLTDDDLRGELARAGLRFDGFLTDDRIWFAARRM